MLVNWAGRVCRSFSPVFGRFLPGRRGRCDSGRRGVGHFPASGLSTHPDPVEKTVAQTAGNRGGESGTGKSSLQEKGRFGLDSDWPEAGG